MSAKEKKFEEKPEQDDPLAPKNFLSQKKIEIGQMWGNFKILEQIGQGGMGVVYKAIQQSPERTLALKILIAKKISTIQLRRFIKEAQLSAQLEHPNIVKVFLGDVYRDIPFLAMAYIDGESFFDYLQNWPPLTESLKVIKQMAFALHYAHSKGVIHRDIKPANILLDKNGTPYLMDFGIARSTKVQDRSLTRTGQVLGTPQYMSPEQARGLKREVDAQSDVYSLGAVLYEIVTGRPPALGKSPLKVLFNVVNTLPPAPREIDPKLPVAIEKIILKAMAYEKSKRYRNAKEMGQDIENFLEGKPISAKSPRMRRKISKHKGRLWLVIATITVVFACLLWPKKTEAPRREDIGLLWQLAQKAFADGECEKTSELLNKILAEDPGCKQALWLRARVFEKSGEFERLRLCWANLHEQGLSAEELENIGDEALKKGYLQDAQKYLQDSLQMRPSSVRCQKALAMALLYSGKHHQAMDYYQPLAKTDPEARAGLALLYYREHKYERAEHFLDVTQAGDLSPYLQTQLSFLRSRINWERLFWDLNSREWLTENERKRRKQIKEALRKIENELLQASLSLEATHDNYLAGRLRRKIVLYRKAMSLEIRTCEKPLREVKKFLDQLSDPALSISDRIFLREIIIRFLLRNELWKKARIQCDDAMNRYPWIGDFYALRAVALFYEGEFSEAVDDSYRAVAECPWNFVPLKNAISLLLDNFSPQEADEFYKIVATYVNSLVLPVEQYVMSGYLESARIEYLRQASIEKGPRWAGNWEKLFDNILHSSSGAARRLAVNILSSQYDNKPLRKKLEDLRGQPVSPQVKESLTRLKADMAHWRKKSQRLKLRGILLKNTLTKTLAPDDACCMEIRDLGEQGESLLQEILQNDRELPIVRLLAARIMLSIKTITAWKNLHEIAQKGPYPSNFFAAIAIKEKDLPTDIFSTIAQLRKKTGESENDYRMRIDRFVKKQEPVIQILLASYIDPLKNFALSKALLTSDEEMAALCAAYICRRRYTSLPKDLQQLVISRFATLMSSANNDVRAAVNNVFWRFDNIDDISEQMRWEMFLDCWRQCGPITIDALLREKDKKVLFSTMYGLATSKQFSRYARQADEHSDPMFANLLKELLHMACSPKCDHFTNFWSTVTLTSLGNKEILKIFSDPETDFFIYIGAMIRSMENYGDRKNKETALEISRLLKMLKERSEQETTPSNRKTKQIALFILPLFYPPALIEMSLKKAIEEKNPGIRIAAIGALRWQGKRRDINKVRMYINDENPLVRRTSATVMAALTICHTPGKVAAWNEKFKKMSRKMRSAVAYGYYTEIEKSLLLPGGNLDLASLFKYDWHIQNLWSRGQQKWLTVLENIIEVYPNTRYYYESALLAFKFGRLRYAHEQIKCALRSLDRKPSRRQKDLYRRCNLLCFDLYQASDDPRSLQCIEDLAEKYPLSREIQFSLCLAYRDMGKQKQYRRQLWLSYLCDPFATYRELEKRDERESLEMLRIIHEKFPMTRSFVAEHIPKLNNTPWVKKLPR